MRRALERDPDTTHLRKALRGLLLLRLAARVVVAHARAAAAAVLSCELSHHAQRPLALVLLFRDDTAARCAALLAATKQKNISIQKK